MPSSDLLTFDSLPLLLLIVYVLNISVNSCNAGEFCIQIFSNKLDLFQPACSIIFQCCSIIYHCKKICTTGSRTRANKSIFIFVVNMSWAGSWHQQMTLWKFLKSSEIKKISPTKKNAASTLGSLLKSFLQL